MNVLRGFNSHFKAHLYGVGNLKQCTKKAKTFSSKSTHWSMDAWDEMRWGRYGGSAGEGTTAQREESWGWWADGTRFLSAISGKTRLQWSRQGMSWYWGQTPKDAAIWSPRAAAPAPGRRRRLGGSAGLSLKPVKQPVFPHSFLLSFILILYTNTQLLPGFSTKYDFCWANYIRMDATGIH